MKMTKKLMAKLERLRRSIRKGPGWVHLSLSKGLVPSQENPFRGITLSWPALTIGTQIDPFGEAYKQYSLYCQTGVSLTSSQCHRGLNIQILGFGISYSKQWDY